MLTRTHTITVNIYNATINLFPLTVRASAVAAGGAPLSAPADCLYACMSIYIYIYIHIVYVYGYLYSYIYIST